jgi:hypothetical protein
MCTRALARARMHAHASTCEHAVCACRSASLSHSAAARFRIPLTFPSPHRPMSRTFLTRERSHTRAHFECHEFPLLIVESVQRERSERGERDERDREESIDTGEKRERREKTETGAGSEREREEKRMKGGGERRRRREGRGVLSLTLDAPPHASCSFASTGEDVGGDSARGHSGGQYQQQQQRSANSDYELIFMEVRTGSMRRIRR